MADSRPSRSCTTCGICLKNHLGPSGKYCSQNTERSFVSGMEMDLLSEASSPSTSCPTMRSMSAICNAKGHVGRTGDTESVVDMKQSLDQTIQAIEAENEQLMTELKLKKVQYTNKKLKKELVEKGPDSEQRRGRKKLAAMRSDHHLTSTAKKMEKTLFKGKLPDSTVGDSSDDSCLTSQSSDDSHTHGHVDDKDIPNGQRYHK